MFSRSPRPCRPTFLQDKGWERELKNITSTNQLCLMVETKDEKTVYLFVF